MTKPLSLSTGFSSSNYIDFGGTIESFNTLNASLKTGIVTTSVGVGIDSNAHDNVIVTSSYYGTKPTSSTIIGYQTYEVRL